MSVCQFWRRIVEAAPSLWRSIDSRVSCSSLDAALAKSRSTLLHISYRDPDGETYPRQRVMDTSFHSVQVREPYRTPGSDDFPRQLQDHSQALSTLTIATAYPGRLRQFISQPMPNLTFLHANLMSFHPSTGAQTFSFHPNPPPVTKAVLVHCHLPFQDLGATLTVLWLRDVPLAISELLDMLAHLSVLTELAVSTNKSVMPSGISKYTPDSPLDMPSLKYLMVCGPSGWGDSLLYRLGLTRADVAGRVFVCRTQDPGDSLPLLVSWLFQVTAGWQGQSLEIGRYGSTVEFVSGPFTLVLNQFATPVDADQLFNVLPHFPSAFRQSIQTLTWRSDYVSANCLYRTSRLFPQVTSLHTDGDRNFFSQSLAFVIAMSFPRLHSITAHTRHADSTFDGIASNCHGWTVIPSAQLPQSTTDPTYCVLLRPLGPVPFVPPTLIQP